MKVGKLIYEGKVKKVYETDDPDQVVLEFTDNATADNGAKKKALDGKGKLCGKLATRMFKFVHMRDGVGPTAYVESPGEDKIVQKKLNVIPIEIVVRNIAAGSLCRRYGLERGEIFERPLTEYFFKSDELKDPLVTLDHAAAFNWASRRELSECRRRALFVNDILQDIFSDAGMVLVDFKLEFGRAGNELYLCDELSPDNCRIWDRESGDSLDKDIFREGSGDLMKAYQQVYDRIVEEHGKG